MRSGTSIMGNVLGSGKNVEYFYEPQTFINLLISKKYKFLHDYIVNDLILQSLAGRNFNLNKKDFSSVYNYKSKEFINKRINKTNRTIKNTKLNGIVNCIIKYPTFISDFNSLNKMNCSKVLIYRHPLSVIKSLLNKKWFKGTSIEPQITGMSKKYSKRKNFLFLNNKRLLKWKNLNEIGRCIYYYNFCMNQKFNNYDFIINYENFCKKPKLFSKKIFSKLNLNIGKKTNEILSKISQTGLDKNIFEQIKNSQIHYKEFKKSLRLYLKLSKSKKNIL